MCNRLIARVKQRRSYRAPLCLLLWLGMMSANAATVDISAAYKPSRGAEGFKNTTPASGFCAEFGGCGDQVFSVALPIEYERKVLTGAAPLPQRWSLQTPRETTVNMVSDRGHTASIKLQITHVAQVLSSPGVQSKALPGFDRSAGGGCDYVSPYGGDSGTRVGFIWRVAAPLSPGVCYPASSGAESPQEVEISARSFSVGYKLVTPAPHTLKGGVYRGSVTFSVGEAGDFSLGSQVSGLSTSSVTFNITLDVQHELVLDFPAGSEHVVLEPTGSTWEEWQAGGRAPTNMRKTVPFRISASGPFTVTLRCDDSESLGISCLIHNVRTQEKILIFVYLTMPRLILSDIGRPYINISLSLNRTDALTVSQPVVDQPGNISIGIGSNYFEDIVLKNPGETYTGSFTLVFDAQI